jgi:hypothetical protein
MEELKIKAPEGNVIDIEKTNLAKGIITFKKKDLSYADVAKQLFNNKVKYCWQDEEIVKLDEDDTAFIEPDLSSTKEQLQSILDLNKLCNVAKYLNGDWLPTFNDTKQLKHYFYIYNNSLEWGEGEAGGTVYFSSQKNLNKALEILGKETIKSALTLNH